MKLILQIAISIFILFWSTNLVAQDNLVEIKTESISKKIKEFKGEIIVINICDPNKQNTDETFKLNKLVTKYKNKSIRFLMITDYENQLNNELIMQSMDLNYQNYTGKYANAIFDKFQTGMYKVYPIHVIINQDGKVVYKKRKYSKNIAKKLSKRIEALLRK